MLKKTVLFLKYFFTFYTFQQKLHRCNIENVSFNSSAQKTVFVGSHSGEFVSVNLETGNEIWRITLPDRIEASAAVSFCGKFVFVGEFRVGLDFEFRS